MNTPVIAFFNNKGGVGKTTLAQHLAWMYRDLGATVLVADLDPQANLTAAFLTEEKVERLWPVKGAHRETVSGAIEPLLRGVGDILDDPHLETIEERLYLLPGDLALAHFEDELSQQWPHCSDGKERAFRVLSAFWRLIQGASRSVGAELALIDLGPNLGAINRAALLASDSIVVPLAPDLYSLQGLRNLGPVVRRWREEWRQRRFRNPEPTLSLPTGDMSPVGYVVLQHAVRFDRPVQAYGRWARRIPEVYAESVLDTAPVPDLTPEQDPHCLALLKHYRSLMPYAQEARKPIFHLKPADGAMGSHYYAVLDVRKDFEALAHKIAARCALEIPTPRAVSRQDRLCDEAAKSRLDGQERQETG